MKSYVTLTTFFLGYVLLGVLAWKGWDPVRDARRLDENRQGISRLAYEESRDLEEREESWSMLNTPGFFFPGFEQLLHRLNEERRNNGVPPVCFARQLLNSSRILAESSAKSDAPDMVWCPYQIEYRNGFSRRPAAESVAQTNIFDLDAGWNELIREGRSITNCPFVASGIKKEFFRGEHFTHFGCAVERSNTGNYYWAMQVGVSNTPCLDEDLIAEAKDMAKYHYFNDNTRNAETGKPSPSETISNLVEDHNDEVKINGEQAANQSLSDRLSGTTTLLAIGGVLLGAGLLIGNRKRIKRGFLSVKDKLSSWFGEDKDEPNSKLKGLIKLDDVAKGRSSLDNWQTEFPSWKKNKLPIDAYVDKVRQAAVSMKFQLLEKLFVSVLLLIRPRDLVQFKAPGLSTPVKSLPIKSTKSIIHDIARPSIPPRLLKEFLENSNVAINSKAKDMISQTVASQHEAYQAGALLVLGDQGWKPDSLWIKPNSMPGTLSYVRPKLASLVTSMIRKYFDPKHVMVKDKLKSSLKGRGEIEMIESFLSNSKCLSHQQSIKCKNSLNVVRSLARATPGKSSNPFRHH